MVLTCLALWLAAPGLATADDAVDAQSKKIVAELVTLLDETDDVTTAVVTIRVLEKLKPHSRPALPAILRCASRLGLFRSNCRIEPARPGEELVRCQEVRSVSQKRRSCWRTRGSDDPDATAPRAKAPRAPGRGLSESSRVIGPCAKPSRHPAR